jgi:hypothetical protein
MLAPPPARVLSMRGMRRSAATAAAVVAGLAAMGVLAMHAPVARWTAQPEMAAFLKAPSAMAGAQLPARLAGRADGGRADGGVADGALPRAANPAAPALPAARRLIAAKRAQASVLLYSAADDQPAADRTATGRAQAEKVAAAAAPLVTELSHADFVVSSAGERPVVLPISFGKPVAPEDAAPPVSLRWRHRGFAVYRHSYFLPAPGQDAVGGIALTASMLR